MFSKELMELNQYLADKVTGDNEFFGQVFNKKISRIMSDSTGLIHKEFAEKKLDPKQFAKECQKQEIPENELKAVCRFVLLQEAFTELELKFPEEIESQTSALYRDPEIKGLKLTTIDKSAIVFAKQFLLDKSISKQQVYTKLARTTLNKAAERGAASHIPPSIVMTAQSPAGKARTASSFKQVADERASLLGSKPPVAGCCTIV
jgi:hypothetical protein